MSTTEIRLRYEVLSLRDTDVPSFADDAPAPWTRQGVHEWVSGMSRAFRRLLRESEKDPVAVLRDGRGLSERSFCLYVFERCESRVARGAARVVEAARILWAVALASRDEHLRHEAEGLVARARQAEGDESGAVRTQRRLRDSALSCCPGCAAGWFLRTGELFLDSGVKGLIDAALLSLERGLRVLGDRDRAAGGYVQLALLRAYGARGRRRAALVSAGVAFRDLPLSVPEAAFLQGLHHLGRVLLDGEPEDDAAAERLLEVFAARLRNAAGLSRTRRALRWLRALLRARLGYFSDARESLSRLLDGLAANVAPQVDLAIRLDLVLLHTRRSHEASLRAAQLVLSQALRFDDLVPGVRADLEALKRLAVQRTAEAAFARAAELRRGLDVDVPGLLTGRPPAAWRQPASSSRRDGPDVSPPSW